jgi:hypothetical protein
MVTGRTIGSILLIASTFLFSYGIAKDSDPALNAGGIVAGVGAGLVVNNSDKKDKEKELEDRVGMLETKNKTLETKNEKLRDENLRLQINNAHLDATVSSFNSQRKLEMSYLEQIRSLEIEKAVLTRSLSPAIDQPVNLPIKQTELPTIQEISNHEQSRKNDE